MTVSLLGAWYYPQPFTMMIFLVRLLDRPEGQQFTLRTWGEMVYLFGRVWEGGVTTNPASVCVGDPFPSFRRSAADVNLVTRMGEETGKPR